MAYFVRNGVLVCVVVLLAVSACGSSGPTAAQAGETLKTHITELMKKGYVRDVRITDPGGRDVSCGEGKAKRTFAATGRDLMPKREPDILNTIMVGVIDSVAPYRVVEDPGKAPIRLASEKYKTMIILESPGSGKYAVRGETECLHAS